jgi:cysteine desulfurase
VKKIYMDHAGAVPPRAEVVQAMLPFFSEHFGNPLSVHSFGDFPRTAIEEAREKVAELIGASAREIYFTSNGSEANNMAIKGVALMNRKKGTHIVVSGIEHQSVLNPAATLEKLGFDVTQVPVDQYGFVSAQSVSQALRNDTILVSVMHGNSEIGVIEPIAEIAKVVRQTEAVFHTDAVATVGKIPVDVKMLDVDMLSLSGNQFSGPLGSGALFIKRGVRVTPLVEGGVQEGGRRAGAENVPAIVGMGIAAALAQQEITANSDTLIPMRDHLIRRLTTELDHVILTGHPTLRLPHHASICVEFVEGEAMLLMLNMHGIAAASGSTCTSKALKASHVLTAIGVDVALAQGSLVFTLGRDNTMSDVNDVASALPAIVGRLRAMSPLYSESPTKP